jgi:hypothetical protein
LDRTTNEPGAWTEKPAELRELDAGSHFSSGTVGEDSSVA